MNTEVEVEIEVKLNLEMLLEGVGQRGVAVGEDLTVSGCPVQYSSNRYSDHFEMI